MNNSSILTYCKILFPGEPVSPAFMASLSESDLKSAFRRQAFANHPDTSKATAVKFQLVKDAYSTLLEHVNAKPHVKVSGLHSPFRQQQTHASHYKSTRGRPVSSIRKKPEGGTYYTGAFPSFKLKTGLFLYHRGLIPYEALVGAMIWQQKNRTRIGEIAVQMGWITNREIEFIRAATELPGSFGNRAKQLGLLTNDQVEILLRYQRLSLCHIGQYFVKRGYLNHGELTRELRALKIHNESIDKVKSVPSSD